MIVDVEFAAAVAVTMRSRNVVLFLVAARPPVDSDSVIFVNELVGVANVPVPDTVKPPIQTSFDWEVVVVVPVDAVVLVPVAFAVLSRDPVVIIPEYWVIIADALILFARLMVTSVPPDVPTIRPVVYHISVVLPEAFVACVARFHVAPV